MLDVPAAVETQPNAIDGSNVAGVWVDGSSHSHGFRWNGSAYSLFDPPGSTSTTPVAVSGINIAGSFSDASGSHGFLYDGTGYATFNIPGSTSQTVTDVSGDAPSLGVADDSTSPGIDSLEPGAVINAPPGRTFEVVQPPSVTEYPQYIETTLRSIATGLGVTYEDLTGDYQNLPFSAARMSRIRNWARVEDWRWRVLIPQFCQPVWQWAMTAAAITAPSTKL